MARASSTCATSSSRKGFTTWFTPTWSVSAWSRNALLTSSKRSGGRIASSSVQPSEGLFSLMLDCLHVLPHKGYRRAEPVSGPIDVGSLV